MTLLFGAEKVMCPTMNILHESFEGWEYRHGLKGRVNRSVDRNLIRREQRAGKIVCRLTESGHREAAGGVDPEARWGRPWDGVWRQVLFDLPARPVRVRQELWRWLREQRLGCLQRSVWVTPDPVPEVLAALRGFRKNAAAFTVMEARPAAGTANLAIVDGAWDFAEINQRYEAYQEVAQLSGRLVAELTVSPDGIRQWLRRERESWRDALVIDPLLPRSLWPRRYRGPAAWQLRRRSLAKLARLVWSV